VAKHRRLGSVGRRHTAYSGVSKEVEKALSTARYMGGGGRHHAPLAHQRHAQVKHLNRVKMKAVKSRDSAMIKHANRHLGLAKAGRLNALARLPGF
jgi:hypothetical protein